MSIFSNQTATFHTDEKKQSKKSFINKDSINFEINENGMLTTPLQRASADDLYTSNSGTVMCFKQRDFVILACDTRHSSEMGINSRKMVKCFEIDNQTKKFLFAGIGFYPDLNELYFRLKYQIDLFMNHHEREIALKELVHVLMNILYSRRSGLIYYVFPVLVGLNKKDEPTIYATDCVGNYEQKKCVCYGSGQQIIQPLLDSVINGYNNETRPVFVKEKNEDSSSYDEAVYEENQSVSIVVEESSGTSQSKIDTELDFESAIELTKKVFYAAAERDVKTGDFLQIFVYTKDGIQQQTFDLRKD
ncbi:hypothetical protein M153_2230005881 [Pseudoloma neurophilia]|uniref:Uncharacterized protein n=1 Tax=Pseudoloma neurophilia TaxID=146866 RepID=A0A0R0LZJ9_9MICR|nr:hypothetical protein M153_2230005881 [Pseudoloma neurophilia]